MSLAIRLQFEPVREVGNAAIGAVYSSVGGPVRHAIRMLILNNFTDQPVMFSTNGIDDHVPMVAYGYMILDLTSNKTINQGFFLAEGQQIYVKQLGAAPTLGSVWMSCIYGVEV